MIQTERRYDIDWLRVIAIALLLLYHIGIAFQPWGVFIGFIQSDRPLNSLWIPMSMLNIWRIPILFFVSGMGVCFAIRRRNWKQLITERARRILLPFVFGMLAIVPMHVFIWQKYYSQDLSYMLHPVHLWFLAYIFIYVLLFAPLFFYMKKQQGKRVQKVITRLFSTPAGMLLIALCFMTEAWLLSPETYATFAMTLHGFITGVMAFLFGFVLIYSGDPARRLIISYRWITLILGAALFSVRYFIYDLKVPSWMIAAEACMWIFTVFAFSFRYLNRPGRAVVYLSQAAYPVYILHMLFLYLGSVWIMPLKISPSLRFILLTVFTFAACMITYEWIVRRINLLRPLFGLKLNKAASILPSLLFRLN